MRRAVLVLGCLLAGTGAAADDARVRQRVEAQQLAELLLSGAAEVAETYVRPVAPDELLTAALTALHEAAQVPVPGGLRERVRQAVKDGSAARLLVQIREGLGNPEALRGQRAFVVGCRGMLRALDPYCAVLTPRDRGAADVSEQNYGVGVELRPNLGVGPQVVKAVVPGAPAQRAGLRGGDRVTHIDGKEAQGLTSEQALALLNGPPPGLALESALQPPAALAPAGTSAVVTVERDGRPKPRRVTLHRDQFRAETVLGVARRADNSWDYWLDPKARVAQVRLGRLTHGTAQELQHLLWRLNAAPGLNGLILDLRWCPGGYLDEALCVAALFLADGTLLATVRDRSEETRSWRAGDDAKEGERLLLPVTRYNRFPVVVLVNGETSGGGELIAAALQDAGRAAVLGQRTRGKASIQKEINVSGVAGVTLRLSTGLFVRPGGQNLHRFADGTPGDEWGVRPDPGLDVRLTPALTAQLRQWWQEQTERPGSSSETRPLDDPTADPVRHAALRHLLDKQP